MWDLNDVRNEIKRIRLVSNARSQQWIELELDRLVARLDREEEEMCAEMEEALTKMFPKV